MFTVRETLRFSAILRGVGDEKEKLLYVEKIIGILGMEEFADAVVGVMGSGLSLVQRKKMTVRYFFTFFYPGGDVYIIGLICMIKRVMGMPINLCMNRLVSNWLLNLHCYFWMSQPVD